MNCSTNSGIHSGLIQFEFNVTLCGSAEKQIFHFPYHMELNMKMETLIFGVLCHEFLCI